VLRIKHTLLFLAAFTFPHAQDANTAAVSAETETVVAINTISLAVFDFASRGISNLESEKLTEYFSAQIQKTGRAILTERPDVVKVLEKNGYEQGSCIYEQCATELGKKLDVEYVINGTVGKLGNTYAINLKMFNVQTGFAENTKSVTYSGTVYGMITELEILAWLMLNLESPQELVEKRIVSDTPIIDRVASFKLFNFKATIRSTLVPGWGQLYYKDNTMGPLYLSSSVLFGFLLKQSYDQYEVSKENAIEFHRLYKAAIQRKDIQNYETISRGHLTDTKKANDKIKIYGAILGLTYISNIFHAYVLDRAELSSKDLPHLELVFHPELNQPQLRLSIALD